MPQYRMKCDYTYNSSTNASLALAAINNVLAKPEYSNVTGGPATRSSSKITMSLLIPDEATMEALRFEMLTAWPAGTRSTGKFSVTVVQAVL